MKRILTIAAVLTVGLSAWGQVASLDDQAKCAGQAEKVFKQEARSYRSNGGDGDITFTSHYNSTLGHCFVTLTKVAASSPGDLNVDVRDAFEGSSTARFWGYRKPGEMEMGTVLCEIDGDRCNSLHAFEDQLETKYGVKP